jgi:hypothetical protein
MMDVHEVCHLTIKMCLNETYSKVCVGKLLSDAFPIQIGLQQEGVSSLPLLFSFASVRPRIFFLLD